MTYDYVSPLSPHVTNNNTSLCVYLSWRLSWHLNTLWKCPSPYFTLSLLAPECEHRKRYLFLVCSYFQTTFHMRSTELFYYLLIHLLLNVLLHCKRNKFFSLLDPPSEGRVLHLPPFLSLITFSWFSLELDTSVFFIWIKLFCQQIVRSWVLTTLIL